MTDTNVGFLRAAPGARSTEPAVRRPRRTTSASWKLAMFLVAGGGIACASSGGITTGSSTGGAPAAGGASGGAGTNLQTGGLAGANPTSAPAGSGGGTPDSGSAVGILHVTPTGTPAGDGRSFTSPLDFATALARVTGGDTILLEAGTYVVPYRAGVKNSLVFSKAGLAGKPIVVAAVEGGQAVFDFSFPEQTWVQDSVGFSVTGSYWVFRGIGITRAGYQGAYVTGQHNVFENCAFFENRNTGLEINKGGAYTTVINCDSYRNYDPKKMGGMADGFGPKETQGPGNTFIGCRAWENSDDAYDTYDSAEAVIFDGCWAFRNGVDVWNYGGFAGNGNGFKAGGNFKQANHTFINCVSFGNRVKGFDQNNNTGGITIHNGTAYDNGTNFGLVNGVNAGQQHDIKNCISLGGAVSILNAREANDSWSAGAVVSADDFVSLDVSLAAAPRLPGGQLPPTDLFRLKAGSKLIDAGVDVGLAFSGRAPDLGAFESAN